MAGVLSFALGLEASNFLRNIGLSSEKVLSFAAVVDGLQKVFDKTWQTIERGGQLFDLSNRTRESAGNIYQLQEALKATGLSSDSAAPMILKAQKSLSGVTEEGENSGKIIKALKLDLDALRNSDAATQISVIAEALGRLNTNDAAGIAGKLFGREGAGNILQISRDIAAFNQVLNDTRREGAIVNRVAAAFDTIGDTAGEVRRKWDFLWFGIAEGAAPAIQQVLNQINRIDFVDVGQSAGKRLGQVIEIFKNGNVTELIAESMKLGFELGVLYAVPAFEKLGYVLLKAFETPLTYLQAGIEFAIDQAVNHPKLRTLLNIVTQNQSEAAIQALGLGTGGEQSSFAEILAQRQEEGLKLFNDIGLGDINADADQRISEANDAAKKLWEGFTSRLAELAGPNVGLPGMPGTKGGESLDISLPGKGQKPDVTALEKLGFVFNTGTSATDHARDTAFNTGKMVSLLTKTNELLKTPASAPDYRNQPA